MRWISIRMVVFRMTIRMTVAAMTVAALALALSGAAAQAKVFVTVDEALELAFPGCEIERTTVFLTDAQLARARELSGEPVESALVYPYRASCGGEPAGTAYFDSHRVRTLPETLMIAVGRDGRVRRIEILSFQEPEEYIPRGPWYEQLLDRPLDADLNLKRGVAPVTGATLTAKATTQAVRRALALHQVIGEPAPDAGEDADAATSPGAPGGDG